MAQKRNLVEEMRTKLREVHTNTESDAAAMVNKFPFYYCYIVPFFIHKS